MTILKSIYGVIGTFEERNRIYEKEDNYHQDNAPCHMSIATMAKIHELHIELLPYLPYSPNSFRLDFIVSSPQRLLSVQKCQKEALCKKIWIRWGSHCQNKCLFWGSYYKTGIEILEMRWTNCIGPLKEIILMNKDKFCKKKCFLYCFWVECNFMYAPSGYLLLL